MTYQILIKFGVGKSLTSPILRLKKAYIFFGSPAELKLRIMFDKINLFFKSRSKPSMLIFVYGYI